MESLDEINERLDLIGRIKGLAKECYNSLLKESRESGDDFVRRFNNITGHGDTAYPVANCDIDDVVAIRPGSHSKSDIFGILSIGHKIWFNDYKHCRLRICGFTDEHIEKLRHANLIDITIFEVQPDDTIIAKLSISNKEDMMCIVEG